MVSDINTPRPPDEAKADGDRLRETAAREASSAREEARKAGDTLKNEASRLGSQAKDKAYEGAESGKNAAASNLNDFTAAIRKASDELGERDQSMAANLVREAASGLEQVSGAIEGKSVQELTRSVAGFARRQPAAFLIGAALAGVALGRFARASSAHDESDYVGGEDGSYRSPGAGSGYGRGTSYGSERPGQSYGGERSGQSYGGPSSIGEPVRDASRLPATPPATESGTAPTSTSAAFATGSTPTASSAFHSSGASGTSPLTPERTGGSSTNPAGTTSTPGTAQTATTTGSSAGTTGGDNVR